MIRVNKRAAAPVVVGMLMLPTFPRSAYITPTGRHLAHPHYSLRDLIVDLHRHALDKLFLWNERRCCEVTPAVAIEVAIESVQQRLKGRLKCCTRAEREERIADAASPLMLSIPHDGIGIVCPNPWQSQHIPKRRNA